MQNICMALPNSSYVFSDAELSHDSRTFVDHSPYAPLLVPTSSTALPRQRRFRTSKFVLLFLAGLLGVVLSVIYATKNGRDQESVARPVLSSSTTWTPENLTRGVSQGVSEKTFHRLRKGAPTYPWTEKMLSWQRTAYHFQPKENWMNDPNGPLMYNGWYHLFYQYNPYGAVWGNIVWGHAASKDLIHWRHLPVAMIPDQWYDSDGVWTGSATILQDGQLIILYTGSTNETVQVQNLAYPLDPSDPLLIKWVKYSDNPVMVPPPDIGPQDFRDPTTAWLTEDAKWRFTIGSKVNTTGISVVYETKDFKSFERVNMTLHAVAGTGMWECVDFFPVSKVEEDGLNTSVDGPEVKHVMKTSLDDDRNDYYALGTYDSKTGTWTPDDLDKDVGIGLRYDYGIFYASKTFYDHEKKRRVLWGWVKETDSESADIQKGWASLQAIPRTVVFDKKTESNILLWPVEEVERLRVDKTIFQKVVINPGSVVPLNLSYASDQLDIVAEFEVDEQAVERSINGTNNRSYNCSTSGGAAERGALGPFGLLILANELLSEQTPVYFYISKDSKGNLTTFFCADHSRSSEAADTDKEIYGSIVPVFEGEKLSIRILVDHSIVESFSQGGRKCITSRIYPTKAIGEDARVFLFNNATDTHITASLQIWEMSFASRNANQFRISMLCLCICFAFFHLKAL